MQHNMQWIESIQVRSQGVEVLLPHILNAIDIVLVESDKLRYDNLLYEIIMLK